MKKCAFLFTAGVALAIALTLNACGGSRGLPPRIVYVSASGDSVYFDSLAYGGHTYKTIKMPDGKVWMAQNLKFVTENSQCMPSGKISMGGADVTADFCSIYGRFYKWEDAMKVCPDDWHLPTKEEYGTLVNAIGDSSTAGKFLKSKNGTPGLGWENANGRSGSGDDKYGFNAMPTGNGEIHEGKLLFLDRGNVSAWWTSSEFNADSSWSFGIGKSHDGASRFAFQKDRYLLTVRCVQGQAPAPEAAPAAAPAAPAAEEAAPEAVAPAEN